MDERILVAMVRDIAVGEIRDEKWLPMEEFWLPGCMMLLWVRR